MVTVAMLRDILQSALDELSRYDDDEEVYCHSNTLDLERPLGLCGVGYIDLCDIRIEDEDEEDEEDD